MHLLKPRLSEKAYATSMATNTYVIDAPSELNKFEIKKEIEKQFEVSVKNIRVVNRKGKTKRVSNTTGKRYTNRFGTQSGLKKVYVQLNEGSHLPFFEAEDAEPAKGSKADDKKAGEKPSVASTAKATAKAENKTSHRSLLRSRKSGEK